MADKSRKSKGPAPATRLRQAIFAALRQRGGDDYNLWLVYSARNDVERLLRSDAEYFHFLTLEFDPLVKSFELAPEPVIVRIDDEDRKTTFDAVVRFRDGHSECREIKSEPAPAEPIEPAVRELLQRQAQEQAAKQFGATYCRIHLTDLVPFQTRILNTQRMMRFLTAARRRSLDALRNEVLLRFHRQRTALTLGTVLDGFASSQHALAMAATLSLVQRHHLRMDIDHALVTLRTMVDVP
jgi:hypothetical protein